MTFATQLLAVLGACDSTALPEEFVVATVRGTAEGEGRVTRDRGGLACGVVCEVTFGRGAPLVRIAEAAGTGSVRAAFAQDPAEAPVDDPAPSEPPVDDPDPAEPPVDDPGPVEPPAEDPPAEDPPAEDPPAEDPDPIEAPPADPDPPSRAPPAART